jgi:5-formyltetrahydrofolate cyclo-ligase
VTSAELKRAKKAVRRDVLAVRDAMPPQERARLAERVAERFLGLPEVTGAGVVMAFSSFGSELPTMPLIERLLARGITVALPRIAAGKLEPRTWRPGEPATETSFGALEPTGGEVLAPGLIDVVATPAVGFDRAGRRVGYGGGFYDRFFPSMRSDALRVGVGFGIQLLEGDLPEGAFDMRVDAVITESETVRCPRER